MTTSQRLISAADVNQARQARYNSRKRVNQIALTLSLAAMAFGLFWLVWILWETVRLGVGGLNLALFTESTPPPNEAGGIANAIYGSLVMVFLATFVGTPIGIMAGIYLAEYDVRSWLASTTRFVNDILLSAPSIVIGLFVYAVVVARFKSFSAYAGIFALALIVIPVVIRTTENMLILVPASLREAAYALGTPKWRVITMVTLRAARAGVITGILLAVARISVYAPMRWLSAAYVNCFRSIPLVMVLLWFYLIVPQFLSSFFNLSPQTDIRLVSAIVAFTAFEAAYYAEIVRAGMRSVSSGQYSASLALGMTKSQTLTYVILPQAFRVMTPLLMTQGMILFQDTALVYIIGLADFFRTASNIGKTTGYEIDMVLLAGSGYFIVCFCVSVTVTMVKKRLKL